MGSILRPAECRYEIWRRGHNYNDDFISHEVHRLGTYEEVHRLGTYEDADKRKEFWI